MRKIIKINFLTVFLLVFILIFSCKQNKETEPDKQFRFHSFREVPNITPDEINAIEALQNEVDYFVYGMPQSVEAFEDSYGEIRGFSALFCEWMTELFGIPFKPKLFEWLPLLHGLETGEIEFTGELTANEERLKIYHMTTDIASRSLKYFRIVNSRSLDEIVKERRIRCGFIEGTATLGTVAAELTPGTFDIIELSDVSLVYNALKSGQIDAFYYSSTIEVNFIEYSDIVTFDFFPLIYRPVSLTTQIDAYKPIITVMEKILENGGLRYLTEMYNKGSHEYLMHKLYTQLTEEERDFIRDNPVVRMAVDPGNYPDTFFDKRENQWKGIFLDILEEVTVLTGLEFKRINDENANWPEVYEMLKTGEVALVPELIQSAEREQFFLWPEIMQTTDHYALISNNDFPDIKVNEILYVKVGLGRNTAYTDIFKKWFPNHMNTVEYQSMNEAFDALRHGEIDMVMSTEKRLLYLTHYLEMPYFKTNVLFNYIVNSKFGFSKDQEILCSIFNKALGSVDIKSISDKWNRRTYDYRLKLVEAQRPLLIGLSVMLLFVLALVAALFTKSQISGRKLEILVKERTHDLHMKTSVLMTILDSSPDYIYCRDLNSRYTHCSKSALQLFDVNSKDIIGKTDLEVFKISPKAAESIVKEDNKIITSQLPIVMEETMRLHSDKDREVYLNIFLETIKTPLIQNERVIGIMGISRDITKRMLMERDLRMQTTMLNALFDSIPDLVFMLDMDLCFTKCNIKFLDHFGLTKEEVIGKGENSLRISAELTEEHNNWNRKVINECRTVVFEECIPSANGIVTFLETIKSPIMLDGDIVGVLGIARNITKRKEMEVSALAASNAKSAFLANMSHEIRTPMNSIMGFSELAMDIAGNQKIKDYLSKIRTNSEWLLQIINNILDISKIESGKMELEKIPFDMHDLFASCRTLVLPKAVEKGINLHFYAEPSLGKVPVGDPTRLRQVFVNFLSNAVKFTNSGIVKLFSKIIGSTEDTITIHFEIKDSGIGMTPEQIEKIFDPFVQAESGTTRKYGGTGLGLAITKNIVEMMGGKIYIESAPGVGTKFSFNITFDTIDDTAENIQYTKMDHVEIEKPVFEGEIMLCEDNTMNQEVISEHLARVGIKTVIAENGKIGVEMVQNRITNNEKQFDLIFMDIHMPVMDGLEASSKILELKTGIPIIAMTANIMSTDMDIYLKSGMQDCIGKPFTSQELWHLLMKYFTPCDTRNAQMNAQIVSNKEFIKRIQLLFIRDNRQKYKEIIKSLEEGNVKEAHRQAHTLKSNAAQIGKTLLQEIAGNIELNLKGGVNQVTEKQLQVLETELNAVINELQPLLEEYEAQSKAKKSEVPPLEKEKIKEVFDELEPLLQSGNSECLNYMNILNNIPDSQDLLQFMEDFEFGKALNELNKLREKIWK